MRNELPYRTQTYIYIHLMEYIQAKIVGHDDACHRGSLCAPLLQGEVRGKDGKGNDEEWVFMEGEGESV